MLAFIEGSMERQFVNLNFRYIRVVPVMNGITWTVDRLCSQIVTAYKALDLDSEVIVWLDREGRSETSEFMYVRIRESLIEAGADPDRLHILVADRMSENVILSDEEVMKAELDTSEYSYSYEGANGKHVMRSLYNSNGKPYSETREGVKLMKKIRLTRCAVTSPSVARFMGTLNRECWWLGNEALAT